MEPTACQTCDKGGKSLVTMLQSEVSHGFETKDIFDREPSES